MRKIGIMGGTFDPVHNGHLMLAETAYRQFDLDQVWFLPNGNPPHKKEENIGTDARHRSRMVALAIQGRDYCRLEEYEVRRREVSCSYQTLEHFRKQYPEDEFYFIIGADSLFAIETWVHPERDLSGLCDPGRLPGRPRQSGGDEGTDRASQESISKSQDPTSPFPTDPCFFQRDPAEDPGGLKYRGRSPGRSRSLYQRGRVV